MKERQYADELEDQFKSAGISYLREFEITKLNAAMPDGNRVDFLVEDQIILDVKAKQFITKEDYYQMNRYLAVGNKHLGLIVNFRQAYLKPKRVLNPSFLSNNSSVN